jgi:membrane dipeptidase
MTDEETKASKLDEETEQRAQRLHAEATVVDGLIPTLNYLTEETYRDHLGQGGVTVGNFTVASRSDFAEATKSVQRCRAAVESNADQFSLVETFDDIQDATDAGQTGVIMGFQDTMPIEPTDRLQVGGNTEFVESFHQMGVRIVQLTYNSLNYVGAGCCERVDPGLSHFGREVVDEMNDLGILVDLSHCGEQTALDAIDYSDHPVVFSHAGARTLSNVKRNRTDEEIKTVAENGGLIGVSVFPPIVKTDPDTHEVQEATLEDVLDHVEYVVDLAGVDHVGFGSDMNDKALDDGVTPPYAAYRNFRPEHDDVYGKGPIEHYEPFPRGLHRHTLLENLTRGLVSRGYSDEDVRKILGGNFCRVFEEVWDR